MILIVPVKPHIKEFFQCSEVLGKEPIVTRRNSRLGEMVAAVFCAYPLADVDLDELAPVELLDPDRLHLHLSFPINPKLITDTRLKQLGIMLEVIFEFYAIAFCRGRMDIFKSLNGAAERFSEVFQLSTDNYTPDAVRKMVSRSQSETETVYAKLRLSQKQQVQNLSSFAEKVS